MPTPPRSVDEIDFTPRGPVFPSPVDWRDQFIYQLLVDRFDDGKDHPPFDPAKTRRGGRDREHAHHFQGGTLRGVTRRLDYMKGLGCTAVWISPPSLRSCAADTRPCTGIRSTIALCPHWAMPMQQSTTSS